MKIYFWAYFILVGLGIVKDIISLIRIPLNSDLGFFHPLFVTVFQVISIVGLYSYVFKKEIVKKVFWKMFSVFYLLWYIGDGIYIVSGDLRHALVEAIFVLAFGLIFSIPLFIGLFKYAY
jgi:hypothetical protein